MAKSDYTAADRNFGEGQDGPRTAADRVGETVYENPDVDAREFAEDEGVAIAAYANYAEALENHQAREDIETLADRRAREYGADFDAAEFMRAPAGDTAPTSGSVNGVAPSSGGEGGGSSSTGG